MAEAQAASFALANVLEDVLSGDVNLAAFLDQVHPAAPEYEACIHGLWHYASDEDIRSKDAHYRAMQQACMRVLIERLRRGASARELAEISFLRWPRTE